MRILAYLRESDKFTVAISAHCCGFVFDIFPSDGLGANIHAPLEAYYQRDLRFLLHRTFDGYRAAHLA